MDYTILIVDDDETVLKGFETLFNEYSYKTKCAINGREALEIIEKEKIDFILSDIRMPQLNGVEFITNLRETGDKTPVIFMTAFNDYTEEDLENLNISACLIKPFEFSDLIEVVQGILPQK